MVSLFVSYSRIDGIYSREIIDNLRSTFGYDSVWFDEELKGGQIWWDKILSEIASRDIFLYFLSQESLSSQYCRAELEEAKRLKKAILPVMVRQMNVPSDLQPIHYVDLTDGLDSKSIPRLYSSVLTLTKEIPTKSSSPIRGEKTPLPIENGKIRLSNIDTLGEFNNFFFENDNVKNTQTEREVFDIVDAYNKVLRDFNEDRPFTSNAVWHSLIHVDTNQWVEMLAQEVIDERYRPSSMQICNIPKKGKTIRPGGILKIKDQTIYNACVSNCFYRIYEALQWSQDEIDFSNPLELDENLRGWTSKRWFQYFQNHTTRSLELLEDDVEYVVFTDITGFYENIDLELLQSDLLSVGAPAYSVKLLINCLQSWSQVRGRGLPQGYTASDILAKFYLNSVDRNLNELGYRHVRWVDDFRIFCRTEAQASQALVDLSMLLRRRGLNLQSAKTEIVTVKEANRTIQGITPDIERINSQYLKTVKKDIEAMKLSNVTRANEILDRIGLGVPLPAIREAYSQYFLNNDQSFDKTLFRFLVNKLKRQKDPYAIEHCLYLLEIRPEETKTIMSYLAELEVLGEEYVQKLIADYLNSEEAIYNYQTYLVFNWLLKYGVPAINEILYIARVIAFNRNFPSYLISVCRHYLSIFGSLSDLDHLERLLDDAQSIIEECEIIYCLRPLEESRKLAIRRKFESPLHKRAFEAQ